MANQIRKEYIKDGDEIVFVGDALSGVDIGSTSARWQKGWFVDLEVTNPINGSITGNAGTVTNGVYTTGAGTVFLAPNGSAASLTSFPTLNQNTTGSAATLTTTRTIWGQNFNGSANVVGSLTAVTDITGGASNMVITAGTGNSRTLTFRTTTSGGTATTALSIGATQVSTFSGAVALGSNNLTLTGSIAATGSRVTKVWTADLESTNMPTVGGTPILTSLTAPQFTTIELGHATQNTLSASSGVLSIEGVVIPTISSTNTLTNKTINGSNNTLSNIAVSSLANGTDGELITWNSSGVATTVAVGTSGHVLTSNGAGAAPTFQAASGGMSLLADVNLSGGAASSLSSGTIAAKKNLELHIYVPSTLSSNISLNFNSDTGSNYSYMRSRDAATPTGNTAQTSIILDTNVNTGARVSHVKITNISNIIKFVSSKTFESPTGSVVTSDGWGAWNNTSDSITSIQLLGTTMGTATRMLVYGSD